jgi:hypothetical protein
VEIAEVKRHQHSLMSIHPGKILVVELASTILSFLAKEE